MSPHLQVRVWVCEARCQTTGALAPDAADDRAVLPAVLSPKGQNPALAGMFEPRMGLEAHHTKRSANPVTMRGLRLFAGISSAPGGLHAHDRG